MHSRLAFRRLVVHCALATVAALGLATGAIAQEKRSEVSLSGDISSTDNYDRTFIWASYGFYLTPQVVLKAGYTRFYTWQHAPYSEQVTNGYDIGARYYFQVGRTGEFVPFVEAALGTSETTTWTTGNTDSSSSSTLTLKGGFSYFISESASFDLSVYKRSEDPSDTTGLLFGTTVRF
jgi:hypothetical protein